MKLDKQKRQTVEFTIQVEGTDSKIQPRLLLWDKNMSVLFEGKMKEDGNSKIAVFEVDKLDKIFESTEANAEIEILCENRYFKPWKSLIEFENPIVVKVNERVEPKINDIRVEPLAVKKENKPEINKPFSYKNKQGRIEEVFVLGIKENDTGTILEVLDENKKKRKLALKKKR